MKPHIAVIGAIGHSLATTSTLMETPIEKEREERKELIMKALQEAAEKHPDKYHAWDAENNCVVSMDEDDERVIKWKEERARQAELAIKEQKERRIALGKRAGMGLMIHKSTNNHGVDVENRPTYIRAAPKVGRNDACPCGSGLKYKVCKCGK